MGICSLDDRMAYEEALPIVRHFTYSVSISMLTDRPETQRNCARLGSRSGPKNVLGIY